MLCPDVPTNKTILKSSCMLYQVCWIAIAFLLSRLLQSCLKHNICVPLIKPLVIIGIKPRLYRCVLMTSGCKSFMLPHLLHGQRIYRLFLLKYDIDLKNTTNCFTQPWIHPLENHSKCIHTSINIIFSHFPNFKKISPCSHM